MHKFFRIFSGLALFILLAGLAHAQSLNLHLADGTSISGEMVSSDDKGFLLKLADGTYGDRVAWSKLAQSDLRELAQNPKLHDLVDPFIEQNQSDRVKRTEIVWKDIPKPVRPAHGSVLGALFGSGAGLFLLFLVYAGNIYAGYEIALFRGKPPAVVCGVAAVAPVVGPVVFLCMAPVPIEKKPTSWEVPTAETPANQLPAEPLEAEVVQEGEATPPAVVLPATKTYTRGQTTFNRRFVETQFAKYCALVRPETEKDMVLTVKTARGNYIASRISGVTATEIKLQVEKGAVFEDVTVPYPEILEVQLKHKDA